MNSMFSAYLDHPKNVHFENQLEGEEIILLLRAAPITNIPWLLFAIGMALVPFLVAILIPSLQISFTDPAALQGFTLFTMIWELVTIGYIFEQFLNYYYSVYIVTNMRVIDIDFEYIINKRVTDAQLGDIEDVTYTQNGIFRSIFNFGDVLIQTAGPRPEFDFYKVPRPNEVAEVISQLQPRGGDA